MYIFFLKLIVKKRLNKVIGICLGIMWVLAKMTQTSIRRWLSLPTITRGKSSWTLHFSVDYDRQPSTLVNRKISRFQVQGAKEFAMAISNVISEAKKPLLVVIVTLVNFPQPSWWFLNSSNVTSTNPAHPAMRMVCSPYRKAFSLYGSRETFYICFQNSLLSSWPIIWCRFSSIVSPIWCPHVLLNLWNH